jgi:mycothiol synthase
MDSAAVVHHDVCMTAALPDKSPLPAGLTSRPATLADVEAITEQMGAVTTALIGFPKHSFDDVSNYLRDPKLDLATDSLLVFDGTELVGTSTILPHVGTTLTDLDVYAADPAVAAWLVDRAIKRAIEQARAGGEAEVTISLGMDQAEQVLPVLSAERGLSLQTTIQRMQLDHSGPVQAPTVPAGVVVRRGAFDDATRRAAHQVIASSFADQPSAVPRPYDDWLALREARSTFDWLQLTLLEIDGRAVGCRECNDNFLKTENCNYIGRLAVIPEARGRGLAKYLLQDAFALDAAAGRTGTILHVDSSNPTPAVGLYLNVGMTPRLTSHIWRHTIALT